MKILVIGPPGSGKGTQARMVAENMGIPFISLGDIIRDEIEKKTEFGSMAERYSSKGELVPDNLVVDVLMPNLPSSFILDGFPRNLAQAQLFEKIGVDKVLFLHLEQDRIIERMAKRRICLDCKRVYNLDSFPPKIRGLCDICSAKLIIRDDDREETVRRRLEVYEEETRPVIDFYKKRGIVTEVDVDGSVQEVRKRIGQVLVS
ncbi:nucleoside monophosphate kinase [candidate division WOR-3 bacterium]|nr:nucleoside monophosphate kinase [candidate division WOR-3 bacterium]